MKQKLRLVPATLVIVMLASVSSSAQQQRRRDKAPEPVPASKPPLSVINNPTPAYLSGEINVKVRGDENPIIHLQMAASGQSLVEFPASDRIFKVNPADPDLVTIEDSPTKETDRYILLRSSRQFLPGAADSSSSSAATSMLVQMTSGMVITLLIYPARDLESAVHRCVVSYDREAIIKARLAAGLAVNLNQPEEPVTLKAPASVRMAPTPKPPAETPAPTKTETSSPAKAAEKDQGRPSLSDTERILRALENSSARQTVAWSGKLKWSRPVHGLMVAVETHTIISTHRQVLVTVRNALATPVIIAPGHPELLIRTPDDRGRSLQVETVTPLKVEASTADGVINPGETARYVITFEAPVLGAKQRLCVAVAQRNAADEPVVVELTSQ